MILRGWRYRLAAAVVVAFGLLLSTIVASLSNEGQLAYAAQPGRAPEAFLALARAVIADYGPRVPAEQLEAAAKKLAELLAQEYKDMARLYDVIQNRPQEFVQFVLKHQQLARRAFQVKDGALAVLAGTGIPDSDIRASVSKIVGAPANKGSTDGPKLFDAVAKDLRDDQKVNWADDLVGARIIDAYLGATAGKELTAPEIRNMKEEDFNNLVQQVASSVGASITAVLSEAYRRVQASWLPSLEQQIEQLSSQLADLNQQLDAMQQDMAAMKQRTDPLPLVLAIVALVLAMSAAWLALRKSRKRDEVA